MGARTRGKELDRAQARDALKRDERAQAPPAALPQIATQAVPSLINDKYYTESTHYIEINQRSPASTPAASPAPAAAAAAAAQAAPQQHHNQHPNPFNRRRGASSRVAPRGSNRTPL